MIKSFKHKGLKQYFETGSTAGIMPQHAKKLKVQLAFLNQADKASDLDLPGYRLHALKGDRNEIWSITVNGNWRMTFKFQDGDAYIVNYEDYH
ncbi:Killer protein [Izhakiella australiensis]|uniref:Killer protein n=1 Tax=Izhakiella australiensis TaxID=1926881 RepID=A0A1S8YR12_9GAMM|nr:type II toxin-antitoxin system RelE/ParE family toxin [Izhakiella australiensis]OON41480.1 Killer protein [Izhakiella australiensis]